ncbi:MAG: glutamate synthase subunit beta [Proteobacteria bacterium]|uniref:Glutamate synthase subunit beta n=1 Tax=Candidatus Avisuccinivibrio stercorigallinarum TaxID=2840704 RepID=A0A9D9DB13_9GAMM|nr:glutamate synthase subunit beta [Candidatus Avisuccinivibrio stercorigallinarum]
MGFDRGFIDFKRIEPKHQPVEERIKHFNEFISTLSDADAKVQAGRCMDCGIPFCSHACPLHNVMPEINQAACEGRFEKAYTLLEGSNNFPEITGRICPALCEEGCTLSLTDKAVGIKSVERKLADFAFEHGLVKARKAVKPSGKKVGIVGSGPSALVCAQELARLGHQVTVFEKNDSAGGLLRYGIPDFKLQKGIIDRRIRQLEQEGVSFKLCTQVGSTEALEAGVHSDAQHFVSADEMLAAFDAVVLCPGSEVPRDLPLEGRNLPGIYFALDFLIAQNRENNGAGLNPIDVKGLDVVVIGGGETASDCIGTAIRKGAASVTQLDYHEKLPEHVEPFDNFPYWKAKFRTSTSQEEGCTRLFACNTEKFCGKDKLTGVDTCQVKWGPGRKITKLDGTAGHVKADIALIAMGYAHPSATLAKAFALETDKRGNLKAELSGPNAYRTSNPKVFAAGDGRRGQSLVVYAMKEGRDCAQAVHQSLCAVKSE